MPHNMASYFSLNILPFDNPPVFLPNHPLCQCNYLLKSVSCREDISACVCVHTYWEGCDLGLYDELNVFVAMFTELQINIRFSLAQEWW